jgi:peroxiredoxin family protein
MRMGGTHLSMPQVLGVSPGMAAMASWMMRGKIDGLGVLPVGELLTQIHDAGGHLWACKMSVDMMKLKREDFVDEVEDIINVSEFLDLSRDAQTIFV